ncbi:otubain [Trifolium medium]|uniref:Otubain n=1 Tax=Trifolium medium TaxID=97028 RepID=A0A392P345_9FABA|nr:otubain [Trifolium medium]
MTDESKPLDELKPDVDKPDVDSKPNNAQPEEEVVDSSSHFATGKKYKDRDVLINWVRDEAAKLGFIHVERAK